MVANIVVETARSIQLPAAKLSLEIASRIDDAATALSARAEDIVVPVAKAPAKKAVKRVRRAA